MKCTLFGTDGIRATVGHGPLTMENIHRLARALALWIEEHYGAQARIIIGHDTRASGEWIKSLLYSGLLTHSVQIYDGGILTTPALYYLTRHHHYDCGIMISASHNPYQDNGIKIIDARTGKLSLEHEERITALFYQSLAPLTYTTFGTVQSAHNAYQQYHTYLSAFFSPDYLQGRTIVLDCAHGATAPIARSLFEQHGARIITINAQPNGTNINNKCGALFLSTLQHAVLEHNADAGFAFDGDGDRVMAVTRQGIIKDGDDILALLLHHPAYAAMPHVTGTIMSNKGLQVYVENKGKQLLRTAVGDKYIAESLEKHNTLLGGEQSGHIIVRDYLPTGDGIFTALRVLQTIIATENWDMHTFTKFPQILMNVPIGHKKDLSSPAMAQLINKAEEQLHTGRVLVRYSGTENLIRVMVEDDTFEHAQEICSSLSHALQRELM